MWRRYHWISALHFQKSRIILKFLLQLIHRIRHHCCLLKNAWHDFGALVICKDLLLQQQDILYAWAYIYQKYLRHFQCIRWNLIRVNQSLLCNFRYIINSRKCRHSIDVDKFAFIWMISASNFGFITSSDTHHHHHKVIELLRLIMRYLLPDERCFLVSFVSACRVRIFYRPMLFGPRPFKIDRIFRNFGRISRDSHSECQYPTYSIV